MMWQCTSKPGSAKLGEHRRALAGIKLLAVGCGCLSTQDLQCTRTDATPRETRATCAHKAGGLAEARVRSGSWGSCKPQSRSARDAAAALQRRPHCYARAPCKYQSCLCLLSGRVHAQSRPSLSLRSKPWLVQLSAALSSAVSQDRVSNATRHIKRRCMEHARHDRQSARRPQWDGRCRCPGVSEGGCRCLHLLQPAQQDGGHADE